jgi:hypothetical protein
MTRMEAVLRRQGLEVVAIGGWVCHRGLPGGRASRYRRGMRTLTIASLFVAMSVGCSENCGLGSQLNGKVYDAFVRPVEYVVSDANTFPGAASPANGPLMLSFEWGSANVGPVTVFMDGQAFEGNGSFFEQECGNFQASWGGEYIAEDSTHVFATAGQFQFFEEDGQNFLAGQLDYLENYKSKDGQVAGSFTVPIAQLEGVTGGVGGTTPSG